MVHLEGWVTWHRIPLPWGTCLERRIDHVKICIIFMCSFIIISFRKLHKYVLWYWLRKGWGNRKFYLRAEFFYWVKRTRGEVILTIRTFFKLKTAFCEYWTSIKIKINMSKEYEIKKMEQEQWLQLKMLLLLGYNLKIVI